MNAVHLQCSVPAGLQSLNHGHHLLHVEGGVQQVCDGRAEAPVHGPIPSLVPEVRAVPRGQQHTDDLQRPVLHGVVQQRELCAGLADRVAELSPVQPRGHGAVQQTDHLQALCGLLRRKRLQNPAEGAEVDLQQLVDGQHRQVLFGGGGQQCHGPMRPLPHNAECGCEELCRMRRPERRGLQQFDGEEGVRGVVRGRWGQGLPDVGSCARGPPLQYCPDAQRCVAALCGAAAVHDP
mmetsp:Transcript_20228/g.34885  ORF Transcript_20228/g.34885 Transcript_20228/m.34885 type:complete len:236 (+) Transcript_20228:600-1307(+)